MTNQKRGGLDHLFDQYKADAANHQMSPQTNQLTKMVYKCEHVEQNKKNQFFVSLSPNLLVFSPEFQALSRSAASEKSVAIYF